MPRCFWIRYALTSKPIYAVQVNGIIFSSRNLSHDFHAQRYRPPDFCRTDVNFCDIGSDTHIKTQEISISELCQSFASRRLFLIYLFLRKKGL